MGCEILGVIVIRIFGLEFSAENRSRAEWEDFKKKNTGKGLDHE